MTAAVPPAPPVPGQRYKFLVKSAEEAASAIRERLGENARVVSVRQVEGEGLARFLRAPRLEIIAEVPAVGPVARPEPAPEAAKPRVAPERRDDADSLRLWTVLERAGLPREFLEQVGERAAWKALETQPLHAALARAASLLRDTAPGRACALTRRVAFFGSPGAGATTALCKQLASDVFLSGRPACVMKLDADEPNSTEGLAMFCEALGVPLLRSAAEVLDVSEDTTVYFDVPGAILAGPARERLARVFDDLAIESRVLVANAAYERALIQQAYTRATSLRATHVVFTHLDELARCGKLWEFALDGALVPLFASSGPNVAGDCDRGVVDLLVRRTLSTLAG